MSTSTSRAEAVMVHDLNPASRWLTIPVLDERLVRRIERTLADVAARLPSGHLLVHHTQRIANPPRKVEIEIHKAIYGRDSLTLTQMRLVQGQRKDWENVCPDLIAVASEIATRWPEAARPGEIALITDGRSLWFNPGRPEGARQSWLRDHLSGKSPCAMIHKGEGPMPLQAPESAQTEGRSK